MAGYIWHIIHCYEFFLALSEKTRAQMPSDALRSMMLGAVIPDLAERENKNDTHFTIPHPIYGASYEIPDMEKVQEHFLKKDPTRLGVLCHLRYDLDHINNFLLKYFKPVDQEMYLNEITGETIDGLTLWGDWREVYGQLYQLYDRFNGDMAKMYTADLAAVFGQDVTADKEGFLELMKYLFTEHVPLSGIEEMDKYRGNDKLYKTIKDFFEYGGSGCTINATTDELLEIVKQSARNLAKQVDELYAA